MLPCVIGYMILSSINNLLLNHTVTHPSMHVFLYDIGIPSMQILTCNIKQSM